MLISFARPIHMMEEPLPKVETQQTTVGATSRFPGFKFSPTDVELGGCEKGVEVIAEVEIYCHEPWDLPMKSVNHSENEGLYFSARGRKYPYGMKERNVKAGNRVIGMKRILVLHKGHAPKGEKTEWTMYECCLVGKLQLFARYRETPSSIPAME